MSTSRIPCALVLASLVASTAPSTATAADGVTVGGRVLAPSGGPVAEARILLLPEIDPATEAQLRVEGRTPQPASQAVTNAEGWFRVDAPRAGVWRLRIEATGFAPIESSLVPLIEPSDLPDAKLSGERSLTIRVTGPDGKPVPGAHVRLVSSSDGSFLAGRSVWRPGAIDSITGDDGSTRLARGEGHLLASVHALGYVAQERRVSHGGGLAFRLERGRSATVEVVTPDGIPVAGVLIAAGSARQPLGFTDREGKLSVAFPPSAEFVVAALAPDGRHAERRVAAPVLDPKGKPAPVRFVLTERAAVAGRVVDLETRRAIEGAVVWDSEAPRSAAITDAAGGFTLWGVAGTPIEVAAGATGYLEAEPSAVVLDGRPGPTIALGPAAAVEGTVTDPHGEPVGGARVGLRPRREGDGIRIVMGGGERLPEAVTSSRGRFRIQGIEPGRNYELETRASGYAPDQREIVALKPREVRGDIRVELTPGRRVIGHVVDREGRSLPEVEVRLRPSSAGPRRFAGMEVLGGRPGGDPYRATTNDEGRFDVGGLPVGSLDLELRRTGFARKNVDRIEVAKGDGPVDLGDFVLDVGERLQGRVVDPKGAPIEGVEIVRLPGGGGGPRMMLAMGELPGSKPEAVTGPDGWFAVDELSKGDPVSLSFRRRGYETARQAAIDVPRTQPLEVVMQPASRVEGRVVDGDGKPLPGATVRLMRRQTGGGGGEMFTFLTQQNENADAEGRFVFEDIAPGKISLTASAPGRQDAKIEALEVPKGEDLKGIELILKAGAVVEGRITAPDGRPAIGAAVRAISSQTEPVRFAEGDVAADGDGYYRLENVVPGNVSVEATHDDFGRVVRDLESRAGINHLDLQFEGGRTLTGRVMDAAGGPVPGAWLRLAHAGREWGGPETTADTDGTFRFEGISDGDYAIWAGKRGFSSSSGDPRVTVAGAPLEGIEVRLMPGVVLTGTISGIEPEHLAQVDVRALPVDGVGGRFGAPDRGGVYRIEDLGPGAWRVVAMHPPSGQQVRGEVSITAGQSEARLDLRFGGGLTLSGRAVHGEVPVRNAAVFARGTDVNQSGTGRTDAEGRFRISGLEPGTYRVDLNQWDTGLVYGETIEVRASREVLLRVPTARIKGRVADAVDRTPLPGARVSISAAEGSATPDPFLGRGAVTDQDGGFEIGDVADGTWQIKATKSGYATASLPVSVQFGRASEGVHLALEPTEGVSLEVRHANGRFPEEVSGAVLDGSGRSVVSGRWETGENGRVRLSTVPPGRWQILVGAAGSGTATLEALAPGGPLPVVLPPACTLRVRVPALEGSNVAATVSVIGADGRPHRSIAWWFGGVTHTWPVVAARAQIDDLPPGTWEVEVKAADGRAWRGAATTAPGVPADVAVE